MVTLPGGVTWRYDFTPEYQGRCLREGSALFYFHNKCVEPRSTYFDDGHVYVTGSRYYNLEKDKKPSYRRDSARCGCRSNLSLASNLRPLNSPTHYLFISARCVLSVLPWCSSVRLSVCPSVRLGRACIVIIRCTLARIQVYGWTVQCSGHPGTNRLFQFHVEESWCMDVQTIGEALNANNLIMINK